jgi:hypothetical protein
MHLKNQILTRIDFQNHWIFLLKIEPQTRFLIPFCEWNHCNQKKSARLYNQPETPNGSTQSWVLWDYKSNHNPWSSLTLRLRMFSHTFSDLHTNTTDTHTKSVAVFTEPRTHIFIHKLTSEYKFSHSSVFIRNQTTTQPICWRSGKLQQLSQVFHKTDIQSYLSMHLWVYLLHSALLFHPQH